MDPITPGTWPQVLAVALFLWLFAWLPVFVYPASGGAKRRRTTAGYLAGMALLAATVGAAGTFVSTGLGGLGILVYAFIVTAWTAQAVKARRRKRQLIRNIDQEIRKRSQA